MKHKRRSEISFLANELRTLLRWSKLKPVNCVPHGHFFSPIVSKIDITEYKDKIWEEATKDTLVGIDLNVNEQLSLLNELSLYYSELPFTEEKLPANRYYFNNISFTYTDAIVLYGIIRRFKPQRIIEIGSGYSSAVMLDTRDKFWPGADISFIEPYPELLYSLFTPDDKAKCKVYDTKVQNIDLEVFSALKENDILFIDSSHVSKTGSDVNFELFKIIPSLNSGVIIHFHDVFYPFEYPEEWVYEGRNWNEDYLLRAFLSYNNKFKIMLFSNYLHKHFENAFSAMPLTYKNSGGSLWIRKL